MSSPESRHDELVEALLAVARGGAMPDLESAGSVEERVSFTARLQQARALVALPRRPAPSALGGYVVAALQAGARETRTVDFLRALAAEGPHRAPAVLGERVAASIDRLRAPAVLDTRVEERLAQPGAGLPEACLARLPRLAAPDELATRLAAPGASGTAGLEFVARRGRERSRGLQRAALLACTTLLLLGLGVRFGPGLGLGPDDDARARAAWDRRIVVRSTSPGDIGPVRARLALTFEVVEHESVQTARLSPEQRALVGGLADAPLEGGS